MACRFRRDGPTVLGYYGKTRSNPFLSRAMSRRRQIHSSAVKRWPKWMVRRCCRNWIKVELTHFCGEDDGIAIFHPKKLFFSRVLICLNWFCRFFSVSHSEAINVHFSLFIIPARPTGDMFRMRWVQSAVCVWCGWVAWWQSTIWLMESSFGHTFIGSNCCIYPAFFFFLLPLNAWWFCVNYNVLLLGGPSGELREIWWYHRINKHLRIIMPVIKDILGTFTMEKWVADCVHKVCVSFDLLSQLTAR